MQKLLSIAMVSVFSLTLTGCGKGPSASEVELLVKMHLLDEHLYNTLGENGYRIEQHLTEVTLAKFELAGCEPPVNATDGAAEIYVCTASYQATVAGEQQARAISTVTIEKSGKKWRIVEFS